MKEEIDHLFEEISFFLEKEADENSACLVLSSLARLASHFRPEHICEAKLFQYHFEELRPILKKFALTSDFKKNSDLIEQKLEEIFEPEKWQDRQSARKEGLIEKELIKARNLFIIMSTPTQASV
jgi:hypothetical protein